MARMIMSAPPTDRMGRYPKHTFQTKEATFTAQPFMLARVLPGETLQSLHFEARVITDPVLSPIIGWRKEFYFFYCRVTDLVQSAMKELFVDPTNAEVAGFDEAANITRTYTAKGGIDWMGKCLDKVVEHYFRDQDETAASRTITDGSRIVQIRDTFFMDSMTDKDLFPEGAALASATDMGDLERLLDAFEMLRSLNMVNMTYEDWLRTNGIPVPEKDEGKPELLYRFGEYQYPSNTVDPQTGIPASAVSWVFKQTAKEPKFFKEPGFVIGVSVTRPKVYFAGLAGSAAGFAQRATDWMPNYMRSMPETSLKLFAAGTGPLGDRTTDTDQYWLDMNDELLYGDQWQNRVPFAVVPVNTGSVHLIALPDSTLNFKYPSEDMINSFFVQPLDANGANRVRQDGVVSLSIKGMQTDFTRGNIATV